MYILLSFEPNIATIYSPDKGVDVGYFSVSDAGDLRGGVVGGWLDLSMDSES